MKNTILTRFSWLLLVSSFFMVACDDDENGGLVDEPIASFEYEIDDNDPLKVSFTSTTTNAKGLSWDFGDGSDKSTEENPVHTYADGGTYEVTLTAIGDGGNTVVSETIVLEGLPPVPVAAFNYTVDVDNPLVVHFANTSQNATDYTWEFGHDGQTSNETSPSFTYSETGTYQVKLTAVGEGGEHSITRDVTVGEPGGGDPVNVLEGSEMNAEDADKWSVVNYRGTQFNIELNGKLQIGINPGENPNSLIYQVVHLDPGVYELNADLAVTGLTNGWIEFNIIPGDEAPTSDPGGDHMLSGWDFWCGGNEVEGKMVDVACKTGTIHTKEITEAGPYVVGVKVGFTASGSLTSPILLDNITLIPVE